MDRDGLKNAKAKLEDELKSYKVDLEALKKRLHEVEQENRKLAHDREELARAYKDTDALKVRLEQRVQVRKHKNYIGCIPHLYPYFSSMDYIHR